MSQPPSDGQPSGLQGSAPYPSQDSFPQLQNPEAHYPSQSRQPPPRPSTGPSPKNNPSLNQGQAPYPTQNTNPYPTQNQNQAQGHTPYPSQGQTPYPSQGQTPYPSQGQTPYLSQGQTPYPSQGQAPYPSKGQAPYPSQGQAPYPSQGQAPYPSQGQTTYPSQGQAPYPSQGQTPHPTQGQTPYPSQGLTQYPSQAQTPYPSQGQTPYAAQSQAPYSPQSRPPNPSYQNYNYTPTNINPAQNQASPYGNKSTSGQAQHLSGSAYRHPPRNPSAQMQGDRIVRAGTDDFKSRVEIRIECRNLLNKDVMSKSDPCAALYMQRAGKWEEVGRTENVKNCLDPRFSRCFVVNYFFEEVQKIKIGVYDIDNATPQLSDDDFLGQMESTLGNIVSNTPFTSQLYLKNKKKAGQGTITVRTEELKEGSENVMLTFRGQKLDKKDFLGKSDPYLEIQRATQDGSWQIIHRTEVVKNTLNPSWRPFQLSIQSMCGGNRQQQIKIDCYDWDSDGGHDYIGSFTTSLEEMLKSNEQEVSWACVNEAKKAKKKHYTNSGNILLSGCKIFKDHTFLDFITGGLQINFTVGVDFTASNGNPSSSSSLHYINPYEPNEYMAAIKAVGEVCQDYDTDKLFPALGFGAKIPPAMQVSHEFAINFNPQNPFCQGIDGVLQAYFNCIQQVQLYGPTNAAPIINHVANFAAAAQRDELNKGAHAYYILLMLTDGVLSDMSNTKSAIVNASKLPMSLIIVGVGQADFDDMEVLDADNGLLKAPNGEPAKRDIVQFVPFREFKNASSVELARHVLAEVPKQVTEYFKQRSMQPLKKQQM